MKKLNHSTFITGVWIPYNGWRFKTDYDIKLHTGEILKAMYPNGNSWHGSGRRVNDDEVAEIRSIPDDEVRKYHYTGKERMIRDLSYFGHDIPCWLEDENRFMRKESLPEGYYIQPIKQAIWFACVSEMGERDERYDPVILTVTGKITQTQPTDNSETLLKLLKPGKEKHRLITHEELMERMTNEQ
ncbi:hypothetical protein [Aeromonas phage ZPAH34]|uniref:hypothetical protein n=1 Tax=Aeromonas phage ZPAH34 TaxID=2924888 RepID=UPI0023295CD4|nr:hypothetical protein PQD16_gp173 [Aeromonas phage ZPAH34]UOX39510.1 hypothetical protein [Aeromonas phage ZPAH34]